mgnify:CR=1 FL=1
MEYNYITENTCPELIKVYLTGDTVTEVQFLGGGCPGNLQALTKLVKGMKVSEIEKKLSGIMCGVRGTSCADQLSRAVKEAYEKSKQLI